MSEVVHTYMGLFQRALRRRAYGTYLFSLTVTVIDGSAGVTPCCLYQ